MTAPAFAVIVPRLLGSCGRRASDRRALISSRFLLHGQLDRCRTMSRSNCHVYGSPATWCHNVMEVLPDAFVSCRQVSPPSMAVASVSGWLERTVMT